MPHRDDQHFVHCGPPPVVVAGAVLATILLVALPAALAGCASGSPGEDLVPDTVLSRYAWQAPAAHGPLPRGLDEVSGLVSPGPQGLLAHDDNVSTLWKASACGAAGPRAERIAGSSRVEADFEGITVAGGNLYLLTSPGRLLRSSREPPAGTTGRAPTPVATPVEGRCNFEGLTAREDTGAMYLACKYPFPPRPGKVLLYVLEPHPGGWRSELLEVDVSPVLDALGVRRLRPSGLEWLPAERRLLVLAGKERVILEVAPAGRLLSWRRLERRWHRQAEGLAIAADGAVVIADEADGRRATLTCYRPPAHPAGPSTHPP